MTLERLEAAYNLALEILQGREEDGKRFVPIVQRLERELQAMRGDEDDYGRFMKLPQRKRA